MKNIWILIANWIVQAQAGYPTIPLYGYYRKDADIQNSMVGITLSLKGRDACPVVIIHDDVLPEPALSRMLSEFKGHRRTWNLESLPTIFIILDLAPQQLPSFDAIYNTTDPVEIILKFLHILYRRSECYNFIIWIEDPKYLELNSEKIVHPGWRENDVVLLASHHTMKLHRSLSGFKFWNDIPNIIGLKRKYDGEVLASNEIRIYTVIPYFSVKRLQKSQEIDVWLVNEGRFLLGRRLFFDRFRGFNGASLSVGVYWKEPFLIWGDYKNPYVDGLDWRLLGLCRKMLNFSFGMKHGREFGRKLGGGGNGNGSWTGIMGMLWRKEIEIGVGGVAMYSERMEAFGFTKPYFTDTFSFIGPLSRTASSSWNALIFQHDVWIAAGITIVVAGIALKVVADLEYRMEEKFGMNDVWLLKNIAGNGGQLKLKSGHFSKIINVLKFVITVMCQKPYKYCPKGLGVQFVFYGFILGNFILGIVFSGSLIAYLFQFKHQPLADKLEDILNSGVQVNMQRYDGYLNYFMETSNDPVISKIYGKSCLVERTGSEVNSTTSVDDVVRGKSIHIDAGSRLKFTGNYRYKGAKGLKFHLGSENIIDHVDIGWPVRKNWPFAKKFDDVINRAVENGFIQFWMDRLIQGQFGWDDEAWKIPELYNSYLQKKVKRVKDIDPSLILAQRFIPLGLEHLNGVFYVYLGGILLAGFAFICEILVSFVKSIWVKVDESFDRNKKVKKNKKEVKIKLKDKLKEPFKIKKNKFADIVWSDFEQCHKRFANSK